MSFVCMGENRASSSWVNEMKGSRSRHGLACFMVWREAEVGWGGGGKAEKGEIAPLAVITPLPLHTGASRSSHLILGISAYFPFLNSHLSVFEMWHCGGKSVPRLRSEGALFG
ncbi:hypothetical protein GOODEAATRI_027623 [Goodea atripinnis]|uniref:Uncharacterized protein n=1 Tax=Goodea atripinnis TaxID=208336 RepID=A0ABV0Q1K2_9TELE